MVKEEVARGTNVANAALIGAGQNENKMAGSRSLTMITCLENKP